MTELWKVLRRDWPGMTLSFSMTFLGILAVVFVLPRLLGFEVSFWAVMISALVIGLVSGAAVALFQNARERR